jgi:uncharacterized protein
MKVRLDRLGDEPFAWQEALKLSQEDFEHPDLVALGEIECRGRIGRTTTGFLLELALSYEQTLACTRCLRESTSRVDARVDLAVEVDDQKEHRGEPADEYELADEDLGVLMLPGPLLDTRPLVIEQVELHVPMKWLCRDDCAGLCPECGADLNAGKCDCSPAADPRWAALAKLKEERSTA